MHIAFFIFCFLVAAFSVLLSLGSSDARSERCFKFFCAAGTMILCLLAIATISK